VRDDDTVKAVVLTGTGGHFCAGGGIKFVIMTLAFGLALDAMAPAPVPRRFQ
jgi:enoyl-CoA hydratase/carnithine racemase